MIHIGANTGQERDLYSDKGLRVLWIEPIEHLFAELEENICGLADQRAIRALITDRTGDEHELRIASNDGASSSILELGLHREVWPDVSYVDSCRLTSTTLPDLLRKESIEPGDYDALVVDTQGADLLVLRGAQPLLAGMRYIQTEAPDFEAYVGCGRVAEIAEFLTGQGFVEIGRRIIGEHVSGGRYYDLLFSRP